MESERENFETAIAADPYDLDSRKVYADWLDEFGTDLDAEYAEEQRNWTVEKQDAILWLTDYGRRISDNWEENNKWINGISYQDLIGIANAFLDNPKNNGVVLPFPTPDHICSGSEEFWKRFELATGRSVDGDPGVIFRCAC